MVEGITDCQDPNGDKEWSLFYIENISEDFKKIIRENLISICEGNDPIDDSYKNTVREFIRRCDSSTSSEDRKKGMIGELLVHLILGEYYNYSSASALFNLEEKSFKKGFDLLMYNPKDNSLWITEVKSGEVVKEHKANRNMSILINRAKNDLKHRLNNSEDKNELWMNAYNHAKLSVNSPNERAAVLKLIKNNRSKIYKEKANSLKDNVLLAGVLFYTLSDRTDPDSIKESQSNINVNSDNNDSQLFNHAKLVTIQENTYEEVLDFLRREM